MTPSEQMEQPRLISSEAIAEGKHGLTARQQHFLERIESLAKRREELLRTNPENKQGLMLLSRGIY